MSEVHTDERRLRVAKVNPCATIPRRATALSAGFDLTSIECAIIPPMSRKLLSTGLVIAVPEGTYGRIAPRSGLALRSGICVGAGVVDADYTGVVSVLLFNLDASEPFEVRIGERVAQLILEKVELGGCGGQDAELVSLESLTTTAGKEQEDAATAGGIEDALAKLVSLAGALTSGAPQGSPPGPPRGSGGFGSTGS